MRPERSQQTTDRSGILTDRPGKAGTLSLVAVPIGHVDDLTIRALQTLADADVIAYDISAAALALLEAGVPQVVATIAAGRSLGEMAVIDGEKRSASCVAGQEEVLVAMPSATPEAIREVLNCAAEAGVKQQLVYYYFRTMDELLLGLQSAPRAWG